MNKVAIIILHYKNWPDTQACLGSLKKLKKAGFAVQVIVVNNSGEPEIERLVKRTYPTAVYLAPRRNLGFAGGNNLGIHLALAKKVDYILLLNNDTVMGPACLKRLIGLAEEHPKVGIVGPAIKHKVGRRTLYDYGGVINWFLGQARHINKTDDSDKKIYERDFVTGCCMLVKAAVFRKIGLLNESYFLYMEDVEFCARVKAACFQIKLNPRAKIYHKGSRSASEWLKIKYSWLNSLRFSLKWVPWPWKLAALVHNSFFYPFLLIVWQLKRLKRFFLSAVLQ